MRPEIACLAGLSVVMLAGCSAATFVPPSPHRVVFQYSCCRHLQSSYRPGETIVLHWIASSAPDMVTSSSAPVLLEAYLTGPFGSVGSAKNAEKQPRLDSAAPLLLTELTGGAPTSEIRIPKSTPTGLLNLTTTVKDGGTRVSGTMTIKIKSS